MKERNIYLDILKAVNIILVVLGHCIQYGSGTQYSTGAFFENPVFMFIYSFHMPLFMLISGYLFAFSFKNKDWKEILLIKFKQLIIPLFCWSVISLFIAVIKSEESVNALWIIKKLITGFIYGPWFLWALWWCSVIVIIVRRFFSDNAVIYILGTLLTFVIPDILSLALYKFMWPYFFLAYLFNAYDYKSKLKNIYLNKIFILCTFIVFGVLLLFYNHDSYIYTSGHYILKGNILSQIYNDCFRFIIGMAGSISTMYLIYALMKILPDKISQSASYIGKNTLGIYIISGIIFSNGFTNITSFLTGINYLYTFIETVVVMCLSLIINAVLKKFSITNRLFLGGR